MCGICGAYHFKGEPVDPKSPRAPSGLVSFSSAGTMSRCTAGLSRSWFEVSAFFSREPYSSPKTGSHATSFNN